METNDDIIFVKKVLTSEENGQITGGNFDIHIINASGMFDLINIKELSLGVHNTDIKLTTPSARLTCAQQMTGCRVYSNEKPVIVKTHPYAQSVICFYNDGITVNERIILYGFGVAPSPANYISGDVCFNTNPSPGSNIGWLHDGINFTPFGQLSCRVTEGSPVGVLTPKFIGEETLDVTNSHWYKSVNLGSNDWKQITN